jgi:hypothetical protein
MIAGTLRGAVDHLRGLAAHNRLGTILEGRRMESEVKVGVTGLGSCPSSGTLEVCSELVWTLQSS